MCCWQEGGSISPVPHMMPLLVSLDGHQQLVQQADARLRMYQAACRKPAAGWIVAI
jgi:hypothetical protein